MKKGSKMTEEARKKISEANRGKHRSEEFKRKVSATMKGRTPKNIELLKKKAVKFQKGQIPWNKNMKVDRTKFLSMGHFKKNSEETKRKISEATKKAMANPEMRQRLSQLKKEGFASGKIHSWNKGKKGLQISWMKGKQHTEEAKIKMKERSKAKWLNPEYRKYMSEVHKGKPSGKKGNIFLKRKRRE